MRRHIFLLILLCLHGLARGQTEGYSCYFWFDGQQGKPQTAAVVQGSFDVDVTVLPEGIHTFHCLVIENDTAVSSPIVRYFMKASKTNTAIKGYYWFDEETNVREVTTTNGTFEVDASSLSEGLHQFHYQALQTGGTTSVPTSCYFLKATQAHSGEEFTCLCTVDGNLVHQETLSADGGAIHWNLDMNDITDGLHKMQIEVLLSNGALTGCQQSYFVKVPNADITVNTTGFYWFDEESYIREAPVTNGTFEVDASSLSDGFHKFHYQAMQTGGTTSLPTSNYFLKTAQVNPEDKLTCICTVDGQLRHIEKLSQQGGIIHWDLDMQDLADGVHRIQLQAVTQSGSLSSTYTSYFMRIASYEDLSQMYCVYAVDGSSLNSRSNVVSQHGSFHFDLDLSELEEGLHYISFMLHNDRGTSTKAQTRFFVKTPAGGNGIKQYQYWLNEESIEQAKTVTLPEKVNPLQLMSLLPVESRPLRSSLFHFDTSTGKPMIYAKNTIHLRFYDAAMRFSDVAKDYADYSQSQEVNVIKALESGVRETTGWPEENQIKWYSVTAERGDSLSFKTDLAATLQLFSPTGKEVYSASGYEVMQWDGYHAEENGTYYLALHDVTATQGEAINIDYEHLDRYAVLRQDVAVVGNRGYSTITFEGNGFNELTSVDLVQGSDTIQATEFDTNHKATTRVKFNFEGVQLGQYKAMFHFEEGELMIENCVTVEEPRDIELATTVTYNSLFMKWDTNKYAFKINNRGNMTAYDVPMNILIYTTEHTHLTYTKVNGYNMNEYYKSILGEKYTDSLATVVKREMEAYGDRYFFIKAKDDDLSPTPCAYWASISPDFHPGINELTVEVKMDETHRNVAVYLVLPDEWENNASHASSRRHSINPNCISMAGECRQYYNYYLSSGDDGMLGGCHKNGPGCPQPPGGSSLSAEPGDPNDIIGYMAESGSHALKDSLTDVFYKIEFENDPEIATAPAHEIVITDTLDAMTLNLSTFAPTRVIIGEKSAELTGDKNFVTTIDMRPEINAIAQVTGEYNQTKGIAKWHITSLDPMTMEPTNDVMQGILPVNYDGKSGIGEIAFDISRKASLPDGAEINNRASIIFDKNEAILTPTWTNIVDAVAPSSVIDNSWMVNDSTLCITADGFDERSGVWKYTWYVQAGENAPWWKEGETESPQFDYHIYEGIDYGFCVLATDSAGNVEQKVIERERGFKTYGPDYEDGIDSLTPDPSPEGEGSWYDLSGRKLAVPRRGINVIDDKKVLVK